MNAQPTAIAHAQPTAIAHASSFRSVVAKTREGTGQDRTGPNGVFRFWSPPSISFGSVTRATAAPTVAPSPVTTPDEMDGATAIHLDDLPSLDAEVRCEGMHEGDECRRPAGLLVASHTSDPFPVCWRCWDRGVTRVGICRGTGVIEDRDAHFRIVHVLRPRGGA